MAHLTYEIYKNSANKYQFVFRASNGQIIITGRQANTILACRVAINSCRSVGWSDYFYERNVAADGRFFCSLLARNGVVVGYSASFDTLIELEQCIELCKREMITAGVEFEARVEVEGKDIGN